MGNLDQSEIMQLAGDGRADDLRDTLRAKCFAANGGLYYFTKVVLGYKDLEPDFHLPFCNHIQGSIHDLKRGYLLPRGHFKSTVMKAYCLWRLCGGARELRPDIDDPLNLRIGIVGEDRDVAAKDLKDPKWHLQHNQMLHWLFPEVAVRSTEHLKWGTYAFSINRPRSFDEETMTALGVGTKDTGFHYDILIYEDIVGEKAGRGTSDVEMNGIIDWFQTAPGLLVHQEHSEELIIGTRWRKGRADLYGWIMAELPFELPTEKAVEGNASRTFGFKWYVRSCREKNTQTGEMEPVFKSRFTNEVLDSIERRQKKYLFSCQYENNPTAPEGTAFNESQLKTYTIAEYEGDQGVKRGMLLPSDGSPPVKLYELSRLSFYDPSAGGRKAACENAIIVLGCAPDKRKFVLAAWSANCGLRQSVEKWFHLNDQFLSWPNYFEASGVYKDVGLIVYERQREGECVWCRNLKRPGVRHRRLSPQEFRPPSGPTSVDKSARILTYCQAEIEDGHLYLGPHQYELKRQILDFPYGDLVDQFDALASAIHLIRPARSVQDVEDEQRDYHEKMVDRQPYTQQTHEVGGYG